VFVVNDDHVDTIDGRPTTGLSFDEGTGRWLRATSARELSSVVGEVVEILGIPAGRQSSLSRDGARRSRCSVDFKTAPGRFHPRQLLSSSVGASRGPFMFCRVSPTHGT
jgi:hypothetical protein